MLHVLTGPTCNNNCLFCMESDRQGRQRAVASLEEDDVRAQIESYSGRDEILFTSGEPTLNPRLETYIRWAVQAGYRTIGVITNGRRLSYRAYALSLLSAGLNKLTVSIHGADAKTHDALTRARGSFAQTLAGLENIKVLRRGFPIDVHTSTVVVKLNLAQLPSIWAMLRGLGVDRVCLNVPMLKGRAVDYLTRGIARYSEVAASISGIAATLGAADLDRLVLADIPPCAARGVPAKLLRPQERFEQFEATGSLGVVEMARHEMQASDDPAAKRLLAVSDRATLQGKRAYYLTQRAFKDDPLRIRPEGCKRCIHGATCPGIWRAYVQRFGESEFVPIQGRET